MKIRYAISIAVILFIAGCGEVTVSNRGNAEAEISTGCSSNADCTAGLPYCLNRECVQCADSDHCAEGEYCRDHQCIRQPEVETHTCESGYQVACEDGHYTLKCGEDGDTVISESTCEEVSVKPETVCDGGNIVTECNDEENELIFKCEKGGDIPKIDPIRCESGICRDGHCVEPKVSECNSENCEGKCEGGKCVLEVVKV